jgi:hypothetical protein
MLDNAKIYQSSVSPQKCQDSIFKYGMTASFQIPTYSSSIILQIKNKFNK